MVYCEEGTEDTEERRQSPPCILKIFLHIPTGALEPPKGAKKKFSGVKKSCMTKTLALWSSILAYKYHSLVFTSMVVGWGVGGGVFFLAELHSRQDLSSPNQGLNPCPLQWKCRVLTTGPPGKSRWRCHFKKCLKRFFGGERVIRKKVDKHCSKYIKNAVHVPTNHTWRKLLIKWPLLEKKEVNCYKLVLWAGCAGRGRDWCLRRVINLQNMSEMHLLFLTILWGKFHCL